MQGRQNDELLHHPVQYTHDSSILLYYPNDIKPLNKSLLSLSIVLIEFQIDYPNFRLYGIPTVLFDRDTRDYTSQLNRRN